MDPIETERLIIRNFTPSDWADLQEMIIKYQDSPYARYDHKWPTSSEKIKEIVAWFAGEDSYLAVCLKTTNQLVGFIAINRREEQAGQVHNLGYVFHPDCHRQGYATEGCQAAMGYVFGELGADRILSGTHPANQPSVRLLAKLGLRATAPDEYTLSREAWLALGHGPGFTSP